jgi:hypothetical protein
MTLTNCVMLFRERIGVYSEKRTKLVNIFVEKCKISECPSGDAYAYQWNLKG